MKKKPKETRSSGKENKEEREPLKNTNTVGCQVNT